MTAQHTPGPWGSFKRPGFSRLLILSDTYDIAETCHAGDEDVEAANAALIASAPSMLRALKDLQEAITCFRDGRPYYHPVLGQLSMEELKYNLIDPLLEGLDPE